MKRVLVALACLLSLSLVGAVSAQAQEDDPVPPAFAPPAPAPVTDADSAAAFLEGYVADNARRFLRTDRRRVRVIDVNATCLQHPVTLTRFGCAFTLRALVIQRRNSWRDWGHSSGHRRGGKPDHHPKPRPRVRIRTYGCLGIARIDAPAVGTPTVRIPLADCVRVPRRDLVAPEPV